MLFVVAKHAGDETHAGKADAAELQRYLDDNRIYVNEERAHQGIAGRAPAEFSEDVPEVAVLRPDEIGQRRLVRREYASGILRGYSLVTATAAGPDALAA